MKPSEGQKWTLCFSRLVAILFECIDVLIRLLRGEYHVGYTPLKTFLVKHFCNSCTAYAVNAIKFLCFQQLGLLSGMSVRLWSCRLWCGFESDQTNDFESGIQSFPA